MSPIAPIVLLLALGAASNGLAQTPLAASEPVSPLTHPRIDLTDVGSTRRGLAVSLPASAVELQSRTAIDHRLSGDGLFGAFGYLCIPEVSSETMRQAPPNADAKDDRLLGASIRYAF